MLAEQQLCHPLDSVPVRMVLRADIVDREDSGA